MRKSPSNGYKAANGYSGAVRPTAATTQGHAAGVNGSAPTYGVINRAPDYYGSRTTPNGGAPTRGKPDAAANGVSNYSSSSNLPYTNGHTTASGTKPHTNGNTQQPAAHYYGANGHCAPSSSSTAAAAASPSSSVLPTPSGPSGALPSDPVPKQYRITTTTIATSPREADDSAAMSRNGNALPHNARSPHPPHRTSTLPAGYGSNSSVARNGGSARSGPLTGSDAPAYRVEHLASFAAGRQFGLREPTDGIQKLKQMEKNSAVYAQPMVLKLLPDRVFVEEENGTFVEQFAMHLVTDPTAHQSSDPADLYNNVLLFTVKEDPTRGLKGPPPEMHIFQCVHVSSQEVAEDLHHFIKGNFHRVRPGWHDSAHHPPQPAYGHHGGGGHYAPPQQLSQQRFGPNNGYYCGDDRDDASSNSSEYFEIDVNTLNRCFDDIERFVARVQSAALAQRELDLQAQRLQHQRRGSKKAAAVAAQHHERSILQLRAQIPSYTEFYELFQKFKLCLNLLAKLKDHIHEPNAPELLHFLFTPLSVTLDACHWGLGRNVAEQVVSPLLTLDACALLRRCLTPKEYDVWMALGKTWRTPPEDWLGALPPPYRPVFLDGFAPYGYRAPHEAGPPAAPPPTLLSQPIYGAHGAASNNTSHRFSSAPAPIHRGVSAPAPSSAYGGTSFSSLYSHSVAPYTGASTATPAYGARERSVDNLEIERLNLVKERLEFERMKVSDKEQQLLEQERRLREEEIRLDAERRMLHKEAEKQSIAGSDRPDFYRLDNSSMYMHPSPRMDRRMTGSVQVLSNGHVAQQHHSAAAAVGTPFNSGTRHAAASTVALSPGGAPAATSTARRDYSSSAFDISRPIVDANAAPPSIVGAQLSPPISIQDQSPRQRGFFDELTRRRCKIVQVTYDRVAQNPKELTVARGEYLEVLNDQKNWWECRNVHNRIGYVPHTILSVVVLDNVSEDSLSVTEQPSTSPAGVGNTAQQGHAVSSQNASLPGSGAPVGGGGPPPPGVVTGSNIINDDATPDYVKQRQGRRGEFRYF